MLLSRYSLYMAEDNHAIGHGIEIQMMPPVLPSAE